MNDGKINMVIPQFFYNGNMQFIGIVNGLVKTSTQHGFSPTFVGSNNGLMLAFGIDYFFQTS